MKTKFLFFIVQTLIVLFSFWTNAQQITFEKKYDYSFHAEGGSDLVQTSDGGYMIAGAQSITIGWVNLLTIKTDSLGMEQWYKNVAEIKSLNSNSKNEINISV